MQPPNYGLDDRLTRACADARAAVERFSTALQLAQAGKQLDIGIQGPRNRAERRLAARGKWPD